MWANTVIYIQLVCIWQSVFVLYTHFIAACDGGDRKYVLCPQLEKVLQQGDIGECAEPYMVFKESDAAKVLLDVEWHMKHGTWFWGLSQVYYNIYMYVLFLSIMFSFESTSLFLAILLNKCCTVYNLV